MNTSDTIVTKRATVPTIESLLFTPHPVLDHGFVTVVDYMGDDAAICQAARVSYGKGTRSVSDNRNLINYLMRHRHTSPFEMCVLKLHLKMPLFVARQWVRHRMASINEYSARYSVLDKEFYVPEEGVICTQSANNKQGRGEQISPKKAREVAERLAREAQQSYHTYEQFLGEEYSLARELARINLPLSMYTQFYWKIDLHNLFHFLTLRCEGHAQYEIREYAHVILRIVESWVPLSFAAFKDYRLNAVTFSQTMMGVLRRILAGENVQQKNSGLTKREWEEFQASLSTSPHQ
ncbi:MAG: FAD-dependent thymidylate synthase [Acetobacter sp.]|nr:FAD-dependent thymidylate synthase [Acetobacter sp.]